MDVAHLICARLLALARSRHPAISPTTSMHTQSVRHMQGATAGIRSIRSGDERNKVDCQAAWRDVDEEPLTHQGAPGTHEMDLRRNDTLSLTPGGCKILSHRPDPPSTIRMSKKTSVFGDTA